MWYDSTPDMRSQLLAVESGVLGDGDDIGGGGEGGGKRAVQSLGNGCGGGVTGGWWVSGGS